MDFPKRKKRAEAAFRVLAAADAIQDQTTAESTTAARWQRWVETWVNRDEYPEQSHLEELRDRLRELSEGKSLRVQELLNAIDKMIPTLS